MALISGLTEEQIVHIFSSAGSVLSFRLVYDSDTGRPKGFGFCEFADADAAGSAVRNLNGHDVMGRELRVDYSHMGGRETDNTLPNAAPGALPGVAPTSAASAANALPTLPSGVDLPAGVSCPDAISKTLSSLPPGQLLDILSQMKGLVMGDPNKATELLRQAPQLAYAIFQALLLMGLVDTSVLSSVVEAAQSGPAQAAVPRAPPQQVPTPSNFTTPQFQPSAPAAQPGGQPSQDELIKQVLAMPQSQIDQLGPNERAQIMALRQSFGDR